MSVVNSPAGSDIPNDVHTLTFHHSGTDLWMTNAKTDGVDGEDTTTAITVEFNMNMSGFSFNSSYFDITTATGYGLPTITGFTFNAENNLVIAVQPDTENE
ncbi:hypothetical protein FACS1894218_6430 [Bacilli bacterium]|nr:hypothetical protein FACS1894218_6430 [Bacilli bacterium]